MQINIKYTVKLRGWNVLFRRNDELKGWRIRVEGLECEVVASEESTHT